MQVTSIFDKTKPIPMPMFQSGFIMAIVKPLYVAMSELDGIDVSPCLSCLESNLGHWQTEKEKLLAAAAEKKKAEAEEEEKKKKEEWICGMQLHTLNGWLRKPWATMWTHRFSD